MKIAIRDSSLESTSDRMFDIARNLGFDGVELSLTGRDAREHSIWTRAGIRTLDEHREAARMEIPSITFAPLGRGGLLDPNPRLREQSYKLLNAVIPRAASLNVDAAHVPIDGFEDANLAAQRDEALEAIREAASLAERYGSRLALGLDLPPSDQLDVLDALSSPCVGLDVDTAACRRHAHSVREALEALAEHAIQIRLRDVDEGGTTRPLGLGVVDFKELAAAIDHVDYGNFLVIDTPAGDDPVASAAANLAFIQEMLLVS